MPTNPGEDHFLEEVRGLFALEAQEWVSQIKSALLELERGPVSERAPKVFDIIQRGITNLGGSAATVELPAIEKLSFALLPLLQTMRDLGVTASSEPLAVLREGLDMVISAIQNMAETKTGAVVELDRILGRIADVVRTPTPAAQAPLPTSPASVEEQETSEPLKSSSIMDALADLQQVLAQSSEPTRNTVDVVIRKAQSDLGEGSPPVDGPSIMRILRELEVLDEQFLAEFQRRLPPIAEALSNFQSMSSDSLVGNGNVGKILQEIESLHKTARHVDATAVMPFLRGLQIFLSVLARKRVSLVPQRFEAVKSRLEAVIPMVQQWVEMGRVERAAIEQVLPR